jgi:hypothetical protein
MGSKTTPYYPFSFLHPLSCGLVNISISEEVLKLFLKTQQFWGPNSPSKYESAWLYTIVEMYLNCMQHASICQTVVSTDGGTEAYASGTIKLGVL